MNYEVPQLHCNAQWTVKFTKKLTKSLSGQYEHEKDPTDWQVIHTVLRLRVQSRTHETRGKILLILDQALNYYPFCMIGIKWWLAPLQDMDEVKNILIRNLEHFSQVRKSVVTSHCLSELKKVSSQIQLYWPQHLLIQISTQILSTLLWLDSLAVPSWPRLSDP